MSQKVAAFLNSNPWRRGLSWLAPTLGGLLFCFALGCSGSSGGSGTGTGGSHPSGSAGQPSSGGTTASGGTSSAGGTATSIGGTTSAGGATGTGGRTGTGGATGNAGTIGSGGTTQAGGTTSTGGRAGSGGATGSGGTAVGGTTGTGGATGSGGSTATGGTGATAGATGTGGSSGAGGRDGGVGRDGSTVDTSGTGGSGAAGSTGSTTDGGSAGAPVPSTGCGNTPKLSNSPSNTSFTQNTLTVSGKSRQFIVRWPVPYNNQTPYRLIIGLHGATGKGGDVAGSSSSEGPYFGLWDLANNSTIFIAPSADGGLWDATNDTAFVKQILDSVEADLCIDTSRIMLEGFSQGAAMSWTLACGLTGVFRAAVGHSGGGVANPSSCKPIPYFGSGGKQESVTQTTQTDQFAKWNGCTVSSLPTAPTGGHACTSYTGCPAADPVRWCNYDGPHTPSPTDSGKTASWMPSEVWPFVSQF